MSIERKKKNFWYLIMTTRKMSQQTKAQKSPTNDKASMEKLLKTHQSALDALKTKFLAFNQHIKTQKYYLNYTSQMPKKEKKKGHDLEYPSASRNVEEH